MHLRIYLWLSCVVLAGYVRATEDAVAEKSTEESIVPVQNDVHSPPDPDLFIDAADDGSGLDTDESSGSGWGAGPGPDDEDGRGSGDEPNGPPDDEDYGSTTTGKDETGRTIVDTPIITSENPDSDDIDIPEQPDETPVVPKVDTPLQTPTDPRPIDELIPNTRNRPSEGAPEEGRGAGEEQPSRPDQTDISISGEDLVPSVDQEPSGSNVNQESRAPDKVVIMNAKPEDRATSFFAQPGILAAVIGGAVVGLLCAILVVMFIVYRMRKKDEGSYALDEPKRSPAAASYGKGHNNREFYA
ncbi:syndecan isoform X1 [Trichoplusia ni]|uniref:Syndecan n=1 Tax=Trichoplusia ni TaxID=7111 RepID=A0A7E5VU33_TRINI|nr:syndecan isoform X1 [Trichoplusia ni]